MGNINILKHIRSLSVDHWLEPLLSLRILHSRSLNSVLLVWSAKHQDLKSTAAGWLWIFQQCTHSMRYYRTARLTGDLFQRIN